MPLLPPALPPYRKGNSKARPNAGSAFGSSMPSRLRYGAWQKKTRQQRCRWKGFAAGGSREGPGEGRGAITVARVKLFVNHVPQRNDFSRFQPFCVPGVSLSTRERTWGGKGRPFSERRGKEGGERAKKTFSFPNIHINIICIGVYVVFAPECDHHDPRKRSVMVDAGLWLISHLSHMLALYCQHPRDTSIPKKMCSQWAYETKQYAAMNV